MQTESEVEMETAMETESETDNTGTWTGPWTWTRTWNWRTFAKYFIRRNCPYSAIWNASEISWRNFQWCYILGVPLMKTMTSRFKKMHTALGNSFPNDVLAELEISV